MNNFMLKHSLGVLMLVIAAVFALSGFSPLGACFAFAGVTTTDLTGGGHAEIDWSRGPKNGQIRKRVTIALAYQVAADIVKVLPVKLGWLVKNVHTIMVTPTAGTALTVDVGITGDAAAGFNAAVNLKSAAGTEEHGAPGTDAYVTAGGKYITAADTIDFEFKTVTAPSGDVVVDVIATIEDLTA